MKFLVEMRGVIGLGNFQSEREYIPRFGAGELRSLEEARRLEGAGPLRLSHRFR